MRRKSWIKLWTHETLHGTTSRELKPDERCIWFEFLCLAGESPIEGTICIDRGIPYSDKQLAALLNCPVGLIRRAKKKMIFAGKIVENDTTIDEKTAKIIKICNWKRYQSEYSRQKPYRYEKSRDSLAKLQQEVTSEGDNDELHSQPEEEPEAESPPPYRPLPKEPEAERPTAPPRPAALLQQLPKAIADFLSGYDIHLTRYGQKRLMYFCRKLPDEAILKALKEAVDHNAYSWNYAEKILERLASEATP